MDAATIKATCLILFLTGKMPCGVESKHQKLWNNGFKRISDKKEKRKVDWKEKSTETVDFMAPTMKAVIKTKLTEDEFNDRYKMYNRLK